MKRLIVVAAILLAGCSVTLVGNPVDDAGWTRSAAYTTCKQWLGEMTDRQREAMVKPLLELFRQMVDTKADAGLSLIAPYAAAVSATCQTPEIQAYDEYFVSSAAAIAFDKRFEP